MKSRLIIILSFTFFTSTTLISQNKKKDSLFNILKTSKDLSIIANTNIYLGKIYNSTNTDSAIVFFNRALKISKVNKLTKYQVRSLNSLGASFIMKGKLDSSNYYFDKSKLLLPKIDDYNSLVTYYGDRGILDYYEGNLKKAAQKFEKALNFSIDENNITDIIRYSNNCGLVYSKTGNNSKAIDIFFKALKSAEKSKDTVHIGILLNNIAGVYEDMNQFEKALDLYKKTLELKNERSSYIQKINAHFNIAHSQLEIFKENKDSLFLSNSEKNYTTVYKLSNEKKYGNGVLMGLEGLGKIALQKNNFTKAKYYFNVVITKTSETKNKPYFNMANLSLGIINIEEGKYLDAKKRFKSIEKFVTKSGNITQKKQLFEGLSIVYKNNKKFKQAYDYINRLRDLEKSITTKEINNKISKYEVKYETEKKEKEIAQQKEELLEQKLVIKNRNLYTILLTSALLILGIIFFSIYKKNQFKRKQLQKEIDLKDALSTIKTQNRLQEQRLRISRDLHDNIGSQLTFIISSLDNLKYLSKDVNQKLIEKIANISSFTSETIHELRDTIWAMNKNEISMEDLHARILSFIEKAKNATDHIEFEVHQNVERTILLSSIKGMNLFRVVQEAINNAIKYANASKISIYVSENNKALFISIIDDGKGFDVNAVTLGNGLSNMEKRMSEIEGIVKIISKENKGTEIKLSLLN